MLSTIRGSTTYKTVAILLVAIVLAPGIAAAQEKQITGIEVVGNERVSDEAVVAAISAILQPGMPFSESVVQEAKQAIDNMGYFQAGVTAATETTDSGVRVVFTVVENPVVKEIKTTGNSVVETEKLLSLMRTSVGSVLNTKTLLQQDIPAIEEYYNQQGYFAVVTENIGIDPDTGVLNIPILEVRIGSIKITGLKKTKEYVVLREMRQKPGDVYNRVALSRDMQRIYDLGLFEVEEAVPFQTDLSPDLGQVDITIPVKERKTGEISIGLGYSSRQRLVGQARLSESNFRGRGQSVNLLWEQSGSRGSSFEAGYFEPWLDSKHTSLGVNVYNKLIFRFTSSVFGSSGNAVNDYDERRKGGSITLSRPLGRTNRGFLTLRNESVDTDIDDPTSVLSLISQDATVTSGTTRFTNDTRDSQLDPFFGGYNSYAVELGTADMNADKNTFGKYSIDVRRYFSKGGARQELNEQRKRLAIRVTAGSLSGKVPFFEQYFLGGAETLRGFREDRFWGRHMFLVNTEYRFPVASSLTGVAFADYGDAWGAEDQFLDVGIGDELLQHKDFKPSVGYGVGIRVQTPIGPLRLDYGFGKEGSRAHFSIGHAF